MSVAKFRVVTPAAVAKQRCGMIVKREDCNAATITSQFDGEIPET